MEVGDADTVIADLIFRLGDNLVEVSLVIIDYAAFGESMAFRA